MPKHSRIRRLGDAEEAKIQDQIASDPDDFEPTDEELANARPFAEVFPHLAETIRRRGPLKKKEAVSIRIDIDVLQKLRATGSGWQSRVNDVLREFVEGKQR
ncbi:BrnA antitoxin family protein [Beijerinckia indica]|uniref:BrnA antitoxin family protein n=1 Tax=Beijerinckia indica subsp. indica (strain ATCC 9039 / DSM 1715 / NCIMB 8712) TaxID=395963 RepID=B2ICD8_BEII9|nr:BrnA antitoxin family protein [Beijerinckia indica]ACB96735.1 conserved hypothetical protein [Beijerinckia indica subsp. indica ATCC 9039]